MDHGVGNLCVEINDVKYNKMYFRFYEHDLKVTET
jgi:hypothetical protein